MPSPDVADHLRLCLVSGVGPRIRQALLDHFGSPAAVLAAAPSELRAVQGVGPQLTQRIRAAGSEIDVDQELELCRQHNVAVVADNDAGFPQPLRDLPDPPGVLFFRGGWQPTDALAVAIVGTRHASPYGLRQAERLAASLSRAG